MQKPVSRKLLKARPQDYLLGVCLICASVAWLITPTVAGRGAAASARLRHGGKVLAELPLDRAAKRTYSFESGPITVEVVPGQGIRVLESKCPVKVCVHAGWAHKAGETIVCLPNRLLIEVEGEGREYDAVIN
jgi:hypothetical protein